MIAATITIQDQNLAGKVLHELFLKFRTNRISAAELGPRAGGAAAPSPTARAADALLRHSLVIPTERGNIVIREPHGKKGARTQPVDAEKQIAVALKAFEQNAFFILADNRQLETLDDTVYLHDGLVVNFIKLTPLVGG